MTIERNMLVDKPVLATLDEGIIAAQKRYLDLVSQDDYMGTVMKVMAPQGEYNLLPHYLRGNGYDMKLHVLEDGKGEILVRANVVETIQLPDNESDGFPLIFESEDGKNYELHEIILYNEGPNPVSEKISFI